MPIDMVGMEAGSGAHHWGRCLAEMGHDVRLMPPQYVRPYVKGNKHDASDAEACCEAVQRNRVSVCRVSSGRLCQGGVCAAVVDRVFGNSSSCVVFILCGIGRPPNRGFRVQCCASAR